MKKKLGKNVFIILVFIFLYLPILALVAFSFNNSKLNIIFEGFTLKWYKILFTNTSLLLRLNNT